MLDSATARNDYTGNNSASSFDYDFKIFEDSDIKVVVQDLAGDEIELDLGNDYTVAGAGETEGGSISLVANGSNWLVAGTAELKVGYKLAIVRDVPLNQETDFRNQSDFYPETHDDTFDRTVMQIQQVQDQVDRSIKTKVTDDGLDMSLPIASERAGKYMAFDSDGKPTVASGVQDGDDLIVTPYIETLLDDVNAATARTTLGFAGAGGTAQAGNIETDAVITRTIKDKNVTTAKINDGAVTPGQMSDTFFKDLTTVVPQDEDFVPGADVSDSGNKKKFAVSALRYPGLTLVTGNYTVTPDDHTLVISGASCTITLPALGNGGKKYKFIHNGVSLTQKYSIVRSSGDIIANAKLGTTGTFKLCTNQEMVELQDDGVGLAWYQSNRFARTAQTSLGFLQFTATSAYVFSWTGNKSIVAGDVYSDAIGGLYTVTTTANTTSGTFSGWGQSFSFVTAWTPATTGTLTLVSGTGLASLVYTSRTITGAPAISAFVDSDIGYYRDGKFAYVRLSLANNGVGTGGTGDYVYFLPATMPISSMITPYIGSPNAFLIDDQAFPLHANLARMDTDGTGNYGSGGGFTILVSAWAYSVNSFRITGWFWAAGDVSGNFGSSVMSVAGLTSMSVVVKVPIEDWEP